MIFPEGIQNTKESIRMTEKKTKAKAEKKTKRKAESKTEKKAEKKTEEKTEEKSKPSKFKFECQKCGACCELLMPSCKNYDAEKKLCKDFDNRPWMCVQRKYLGDDFAIDTCVLFRKLRKWARRVEDKSRVNNIINALEGCKFGASDEQIELVKGKLTKEDLAAIERDMKLYAYAREII